MDRIKNVLKEKWYHIPFWICYLGFWYLLGLITSGESVELEHLWNSFAYLFCYSGVSYINLYLLIPLFLERRRYLFYFLLIIADILVFTLIMGQFYIWREDSLQTWAEALDQSWFFGATFWSMTTVVIITSGIKGIREWRKSRVRNQELVAEKLQTELQLLKSQLNPHFLFNAINSIYFLIRKNPDLAEESLARFSDILRYQLYECNDPMVPIQKELEHLQNFLKLAALRKGDRLSVDLSIDSDIQSEYIPPFILLPLVENAIKHVSSNGDGKEWIKLNCAQIGQALNISIENSFNPSYQVPDEIEYAGGIGLKNVRRRLNLLYPEQADTLKILQSTNNFRVELKIPNHDPNTNH